MYIFTFPLLSQKHTQENTIKNLLVLMFSTVFNMCRCLKNTKQLFITIVSFENASARGVWREEVNAVDRDKTQKSAGRTKGGER